MQLKRTLFFSLLFASLYNYSFWKKVIEAYGFSASSIAFLSSMALSLFLLFFILFQLTNFKFLAKPFLCLFTFFAALSAAFMDSYGYVININSFTNIMETDIREARDLINTSLILYFIFAALLPMIFILRTKFSYPKKKQLFKFFFIAFTLFFTNFAIFNKSYVGFFKNYKPLRQYVNPIQPIYAFSFYLKKKYFTQKYEFITLGEKTLTYPKGNKNKLIILAVGETARAANFSLNGYSKKTNAYLEKEKRLISFKQVFSCGTETSISLPCLFSYYGRKNFDLEKAKHTENLLDVLNKAQIRVSWRDNDSGNKGLAARVKQEDFNDALIEPFCNKEFGCHDEVLLNKLQNYVDEKKTDTLIVLHFKGNHGPAYFRRYPKEFIKFTPQCESEFLSNCTREQIINSYDNAILYTDYVLSKTIQFLKDQTKNYDVALLYISDHGESLGELGVYLHAMPYSIAPEFQRHVPMIFWSNNSFPISYDKLLQKQNENLTHDNIFHSVLGLFKINIPQYNKDLDFFN